LVLVVGVQPVALLTAILAAVYLLLKGKFTAALLIMAGVLALLCSGVAVTVQVRLDTGDQRALFCGIPYQYWPMHREVRDRLLSLRDPQIPSRWVWCAQQVGSNCPDAMIWSFYKKASAWVEVDRKIAALVVGDVVTYVATTHGRGGEITFSRMIWTDVVSSDENCTPRVLPGWENNPRVRWYLSKKHYDRR